MTNINNKGFKMMQKKQMSNTHEKTWKGENYENGFDEIKTSIHLGVTA